MRHGESVCVLGHVSRCVYLLLLQVPACLILQMPRFGKEFKVYNRIVPSLQLDITDVIDHGEPAHTHACVHTGYI